MKLISAFAVLGFFLQINPVYAQSITTNVTSPKTVQTTDDIKAIGKTKGTYNTGGGNTLVFQTNGSSTPVIQVLKQHYSYFEPGDQLTVPTAGQVTVPNGTFETTVSGCRQAYDDRCKSCVISITGTISPPSAAVRWGETFGGSTCTPAYTVGSTAYMGNYDPGDSICGIATNSGGNPKQTTVTGCTFDSSCNCVWGPI